MGLVTLEKKAGLVDKISSRERCYQGGICHVWASLSCESVEKKKKLYFAHVSQAWSIDRACAYLGFCVCAWLTDWECGWGRREDAGGSWRRGGEGRGWRLDAGEQRHSERGGSTEEEEDGPRWACFHGNLLVNCWDLYREGAGGLGWWVSHICMYVCNIMKWAHVWLTRKRKKKSNKAYVTGVCLLTCLCSNCVAGVGQRNYPTWGKIQCIASL